MRQSDRCKHGLRVCSRCVVVTDAGKRMSDLINLLTVAQPWDVLKRTWIAIRLQDGGYDGTLYDTRQDAIRHQLDENFCAYFCMRNALGGVTPKDCQLYLNAHRQVYDAGGRMAEPQAPQVIISTRGYDIMTGKVNPYEAPN